MTRTVEVEVSLSDFDDDDIVEEIKIRGIEARITQSEDAPDIQDVARLALAELMAHRLPAAEAAIIQAITSYLPPQLWSAWCAVREGRPNDAICELDDLVAPGPSAQAKELPKLPIEPEKV